MVGSPSLGRASAMSISMDGPHVEPVWENKLEISQLHQSMPSCIWLSAHPCVQATVDRNDRAGEVGRLI
jgi:hypothetical protein